MIGIILVLGSEISGAVSYTSIRKLQNIDFIAVAGLKIFFIYLVSIIYIIFEALSDFSTLSSKLGTLTPTTLLLLSGIGLLDLIIQLLMIRTFQLEKAGLSASMNFLCLVWALLADIVLFNIHYGWGEILGGVIVFSMCISIFFTTHEK